MADEPDHGVLPKETIEEKVCTSAEEEDEEEEEERINLKQFFDLSTRCFERSCQNFDLELTMLILFRALRKGEDEEMFKFKLATNMKEAGGFEDLVLKYTPFGTEKEKLMFLKSRHRESVDSKISMNRLLSTIDKNDSFALSNLFSSYLKVKRQFSAETKEHPVFESNFDDCDFVIYTNAECDTDFDENQKNIRRSNVEDNYILNFLEKKCYYEIVLSGDEEMDGKILDSLSYASDCKKLAVELVNCIFPEVKEGFFELSNQGIVQEYEVSLAKKVFARGKWQIWTFSKSFLEGDESLSFEDRKFREVFLEELLKKEELTGKSEMDLISELEKIKIKVPITFKEARKNEVEQALPSNVVSLEERKEFLSKLKLFLAQPNSVELSEVIKENFLPCFQVNLNDLGRAFLNAKYDLLHWAKERGDFITEDNEILERATRISMNFGMTEATDTFVGRKKELKKLHFLMQTTDKEAVVISQVDSISGVGGVGKSEFARRYALEYGKEYDGNVVWINYHNEATAKDSIFKLARTKLNLCMIDEEGNDKEIDALALDIYEYFSSRESLFILDGANKYQTGYEKGGKRDAGVDILVSRRNIRPEIKRPSFIITSRNPVYRRTEVLTLDVLTERQAVGLIKMELGSEMELQESEVKEMARKMQYFPLGLKILIKYIKDSAKREAKAEQDFSIKKYIQHVERNTKRITSIALERDKILVIPRVLY